MMEEKKFRRNAHSEEFLVRLTKTESIHFNETSDALEKNKSDTIRFLIEEAHKTYVKKETAVPKTTDKKIERLEKNLVHLKKAVIKIHDDMQKEHSDFLATTEKLIAFLNKQFEKTPPPKQSAAKDSGKG